MPLRLSGFGRKSPNPAPFVTKSTGTDHETMPLRGGRRCNLMAFYRRAIAAGLALCLVLAGMVAFSPRLHHWVEHAGQGPLHVHGRHSHAHPHFLAGTPPRPPFAHARPFELPLPKIDLARAWHALAHVLEDLLAPPEDAGDPSGHEHHSLPQLLAGGSIEQQAPDELSPPSALILSKT